MWHINLNLAQLSLYCVQQSNVLCHENDKGSLQIYKLRISSLEMAEGTLSSSDDCIGVSMAESGGYMEHTNYRRR